MLDTSHDLGDLTSWLQILEKIVAQSANMVVITDAALRIRWVNQTYTTVTGWELKELQGKRAGEQLRGPLTDSLIKKQLRERLMQGESVAGVEVVNYRKNGEAYTALLNIEVIRDDRGDVLAYFSIQSDISEKRALEKANIELRNHLQVAQKLAKLGRLESIAGTGLWRWSSEVYSILELPRDDVPRPCDALLDYVSPQAKQILIDRLNKAVKEGGEFDHEVPITTHRGRHRWVRCRGLPEKEKDSFRLPTTWTFQDVTVYKELIEQKRLTNNKLRAMVQERTHFLEEANSSLEAFSHALSHDLKKPVRHMASFAELVQESLTAGDMATAQAFCGRIVAAGKLLQSQINGLLYFSRMGGRGVNLSRVHVPNLVRDCLDQVAASFPARPYIAAGVDTLPEVLADPVLFREVWTNLIDNAFKYGCLGGVIQLDFTCTSSGAGWTMALRDNGSGFDPAMQSHIFQMFGRANEDDTVAGDGIGLALCQRIVLAHGGRIWAESIPKKGATFFVFLPVDPPTPKFNAR